MTTWFKVSTSAARAHSFKANLNKYHAIIIWRSKAADNIPNRVF